MELLSESAQEYHGKLRNNSSIAILIESVIAQFEKYECHKLWAFKLGKQKLREPFTYQGNLAFLVQLLDPIQLLQKTHLYRIQGCFLLLYHVELEDLRTGFESIQKEDY